MSIGMPPSDWISPGRALLVNVCVIMCLIVPSLYCIWERRDLYPYSDYSMYSRVVKRDDVGAVLLYGVREDGGETHIAASNMMLPFQQGRLRRVLDNLRDGSITDQQRDEFLRHLLDRYEIGRSQGVHEGPPLIGLRVYKVRWVLNDQASNRHGPNEKSLLYAHLR